jgi:thioredoxin reductase (NADPH)
MEKPVLLSVDDDREVLRAVERDLRRHYADRFRVLSAGSGAEALDLLRRIVLRGEEAALLLVDQRMPEMTGIEFLTSALEIAPNAKRVLLTAYADTEAAIRAINEVHLDHYLLKPWHPPEERLYPVLDDLLGDWQAAALAGAEAVRVIGHRWSADSHRIRDFMARNQVPHRWLDAEAGGEAQRLLAAAQLEDEERLPVLVFPDGSTLVAPAPAELAERVGLRTRAELPFYDLVIVGGGPAGLAAAVYAASEGLRTLVVEREAIGGQAGSSSLIRNYLGFSRGISGGELAQRAYQQAWVFGATFLIMREVTGLSEHEGRLRLEIPGQPDVDAAAVVLATGATYRSLGVPALEELTDAGVFYTAVSQAAALAGEAVFVVGGGNSAGQAAIHLSRYAERVTLVVREASLAENMSSYLREALDASENLEIRLRTEVADASADAEGWLEALVLRDLDTGRTSTHESGGLFVLIGAEPHTGWLPAEIERDERGYVQTGPDLLRQGALPRHWPLERAPMALETSMPRVFAVGDVRNGSAKRVASAVGEGSVVVEQVHRLLGADDPAAARVGA